ncbi:MAG TPA: RNB domain-containing ribonuclease [Solirubrobacteraceae bacterium]|nr:RNB domain-containing ribonuclease [Solirubrobacteraceae bacterium]
MIERRGKFLVAEPFFSPGPRLAVTRDRRAAVGDLVVLAPQAPRPGRSRGGGRAVVARRLGRPDVARNVIEALMVDRGLRRGFDPALEREARTTAQEVRPGERRDLRSLVTFTIDPVSARDYDDAISAASEGPDRWRIWVHIADVSAHVPPGSLVDREAYRRATSVYVPGAVEPMLPESLSAGACSLGPGQDRLAVTVEMVVAGDRVATSSFYRSLIRSDERLDYPRVDRIFTGAERAIEPWGDSLAGARAAAAALATRRAARAAIVLDSEEPEFIFDREGNVASAEAVAQTEAHRLIEHLMIAANEQVAGALESRHLPALYRVHERPDGAAVERLIDQLASLGVPTPPVPRQALSQQQAAELAGEASQLVQQWTASRGRGRRALPRLVLRSLKQAYYDHRNLGHSGLQSPRYCHFTSPIRRYPDLLCHRALLSSISGEVPAPDRAAVVAAGPWTSAREREAMTIERDADDVALCFLLERELGRVGWEATFPGEVVGLIGAGAFVAFGAGQLFEGMLAVRRLRGDWWELNQEGTMLIGTHSGRAIRLGDALEVRVAGVDPPRGRIDLVLPTDGFEGE